MDTSNKTRANARLRQERIRRNWRQSDLAEQLGTTVVTVKRWERGYQQPSPYFHVKLCILFGKSAQELGLVDVAPTSEDISAAEQASVSPAKSLALWTVPYRRNPHFTGRDAVLARLAQRLTLASSQEPTNTRQAALTQPEAIKGLGGIGKTQIALEFAYRAQEQGLYTHTLWIHAAHEETILSSFVALAQLLPEGVAHLENNQRQLVAEVIRWLEQCPEPWLLIFDNADELALIQPYLPQRGKGSVLLTTRAQAVAALATSLDVEAMGLMEGTQFLLHRTQHRDATDEQYNEAANVVIALDGFPLALDQAGAYIEETGCGFLDYLQLYRDQRLVLLSRRGMQATQYPDSVATTWSLSFEKVEQKSPAAADLLRLCAFLSADHIPEELLREGAPHWPKALGEAASDLFTFNQMLSELLKFSLIKRLVQEHTLSIHRLVQVVQREKMTPQEQQHWATCVVNAVNTVFPADPQDDEAAWPQCQRYLEQVQGCDLLIQQYGLQFSEAADVLHRAGTYLCEQAVYALAEPLHQRALHIWEQLFGPQHALVGSALAGLGYLYSRQSKYAEAEALNQQALHIWEHQLGAQHPKVALTLNNLANTYKEQGRFAQAESCYQRALHVWEQAQAPKVTYALNGLANVYLEQGKYAEAEPLYQRAIRIKEQQHGPASYGVTYPLNGLGALYGLQGRYREAEPFFQRVLQILEQFFGPEHPQVALPLYNLGELYKEQGKYAEAEPLYQRALSIWEQQLGSEYDKLAYSLDALGELYKEQGKYAEAETCYQRALHIEEQALGSGHPRTVDTLVSLIRLFCEHGRYEQAEPLYQRALSILEQSSHSTITADLLHAVALFQATCGNNDEATTSYAQALSIREQLLGLRHPKTQETRIDFIMLLHTIGQHEHAAQLEETGRESS